MEVRLGIRIPAEGDLSGCCRTGSGGEVSRSGREFIFVIIGPDIVATTVRIVILSVGITPINTWRTLLKTKIPVIQVYELRIQTDIADSGCIIKTNVVVCISIDIVIRPDCVTIADGVDSEVCMSNNIVFKNGCS